MILRYYCVLFNRSDELIFQNIFYDESIQNVLASIKYSCISIEFCQMTNKYFNLKIRKLHNLLH